MGTKTSELIGPALDWAVAKCEGWAVNIVRGVSTGRPVVNLIYPKARECAPSTDWSQGGPLIEREGIELLCNLTATQAARFSGGANADWQAFHRSDRRTEARQFAKTPLIAAMRCYVASKLGDEVEIPEELL